MKRTVILTLLLGIGALQSSAQTQPPRLPSRGAAPLLQLRVSGPRGLKVTFYQGQLPGSEHAGPVEVGVRPGYTYRLKVSGFPGRPNLALYPTLEAYGTLQLLPHLDPKKFPAPIVLTSYDVERVLEGSMLTKVLYLEDPRWATLESAVPGEPVELSVPPTANLLKEALRRGRPLLVLRMGSRGFDEESLARQSLAGTMLLPGETSLTRPPLPPTLQWRKVPLYDPILGPRKSQEECLFDGGDNGPTLTYDSEGRLRNFDPEDTIAEYRDSLGRKRIAVSNRIELCVPRFAVLRVEKPISNVRAVTPLLQARKARGFSAIHNNLGIRDNVKYDQLLILKSRLRPTESRVVTQTSVVGKLVGTNELVAAEHLRDVTGSKVRPPKKVDRPLQLKKWSDKQAAQIGDVVTFYLKFSNSGDRAISDVVVADSLTNRLVYVPGSARASRNAVFTTQPNESDSVIVRWEITGELLPGESGVVSFRARIR